MSVPVNSFVFCGRLTKSGIWKFKTVFFFANDILLFPPRSNRIKLAFSTRRWRWRHDGYSTLVSIHPLLYRMGRTPSNKFCPERLKNGIIPSKIFTCLVSSNHSSSSYLISTSSTEQQNLRKGLNGNLRSSSNAIFGQVQTKTYNFF